MKKRLLSILLALCMLFCLVPTTVFAAGETNRKVETEQELVAALADGTADVIRLTKDIDISNSLTILRKVTLDLNGYVLKMTGSGSVIILDNKSGITGDLTLIDSNPTAKTCVNSKIWMFLSSSRTVFLPRFASRFSRSAMSCSAASRSGK